MSSGPVHNGGAFFLANGAATEVRAPHLRCRGGAMERIGGRGQRRMPTPRVDALAGPRQRRAGTNPVTRTPSNRSAPRQEAVRVADSEPQP
jgi:hypothetical protein